ncbi:hypothetical protein CTI14_18460, partial [Methylobacterium radiotolerans]
ADITTQRFDNDILPLVLLFAVCVTGMMLTVSNMFMEGKFYYWITTTHAVTVMLWLLYLPVREVLPHLPAHRERGRVVLQGRRAVPGGHQPGAGPPHQG